MKQEEEEGSSVVAPQSNSSDHSSLFTSQDSPKIEVEDDDISAVDDQSALVMIPVQKTGGIKVTTMHEDMAGNALPVENTYWVPPRRNLVISIIEKHPIIYDQLNPAHMCLASRNKSFLEAADEFQKRVDLPFQDIVKCDAALRTQWKHLRDQFYRKKQAMEKELKPGETIANKKCSWPYFHRMMFLVRETDLVIGGDSAPINRREKARLAAQFRKRHRPREAFEESMQELREKLYKIQPAEKGQPPQPLPPPQSHPVPIQQPTPVLMPPPHPSHPTHSSHSVDYKHADQIDALALSVVTDLRAAFAVDSDLAEDAVHSIRATLLQLSADVRKKKRNAAAPQAPPPPTPPTPTPTMVTRRSRR